VDNVDAAPAGGTRLSKFLFGYFAQKLLKFSYVYKSSLFLSYH